MMTIMLAVLGLLISNYTSILITVYHDIEFDVQTSQLLSSWKYFWT